MITTLLRWLGFLPTKEDTVEEKNKVAETPVETVVSEPAVVVKPKRGRKPKQNTKASKKTKLN